MTTPQANAGSLRRTAVGLLALAALWNAVYWLWPVHRQAPITLASDSTTKAEPPLAATDDPPTEHKAEPADDPPPTVSTEIADPMLVEGAEVGGVLPPQFEHYTVTEHDRTLGDIADRIYGDKDHWRAIAMANPHRDPSRLKAGQVWRIPLDPQNIQGQPVDAQGRPVEVDPPRPAHAEFTEYVVRSGDTLGAISRLHYGTTQHADAIFAFNRDRLGLRSPRAIRPGQVLHIPKQPR